MDIVWQDLWAAVSLLLVLEGLMPFVAPASWRKMISQMCAQPNHVLRIMGLVSMLLGTSLLYFTQ
jgi:uncharacterized protein